ncbi:GNAT family N-acetyltransferase [Desmospora profundinema]|uniref:RimJ/RimL family protein N-acetyltransferase n=1 Tax=Desmospora profundinema TaxID=1571184 RepID=A0ABU1IQ45_9BACL|nr:GNAT family N-acetyltransferase [Desmospora profundinema]MDR6226657.1 RimJ/RimL family protein N-acetyltransferase [Desmospora profundinema]
MRILILTPQLLARHRDRLIRFSLRFGDKRITHKALRWLKQVPVNQPFPEGTWMAIALDRDRLCGFILFGRFGLEEAFIVVHPSKRRQRVAEQLLELALNRLDRIYTRVACDNIPSLKLCFAMGLVAFRLVTGPTGKPTLILASGNWSQEEYDRHGEP